MSRMFYEAKAFNQPLNNWDVSKVENFESMFYNASSFNLSPLDSWDTSSAKNFDDMFKNSGISE